MRHAGARRRRRWRLPLLWRSASAVYTVDGGTYIYMYTCTYSRYKEVSPARVINYTTQSMCVCVCVVVYKRSICERDGRRKHTERTLFIFVDANCERREFRITGPKRAYVLLLYTVYTRRATRIIGTRSIYCYCVSPRDLNNNILVCRIAARLRRAEKTRRVNFAACACPPHPPYDAENGGIARVKSGKTESAKNRKIVLKRSTITAYKAYKASRVCVALPTVRKTVTRFLFRANLVTFSNGRNARACACGLHETEHFFMEKRAISENSIKQWKPSKRLGTEYT